MARNFKQRTLNSPPKMNGYKPFGIPICEIGTVTLLYEEFESIKMVCYDDLSQDIAAEKMNVSRPTFTRIYNKALKTIAKGFVEGKAIMIEGGNFHFEDNWYKCNDCLKVFIMNDSNSKQCLFCKSDNIVNIYNTEKMNKEKNEGFGPGGYCICVKCNTKIPHATGKPCRLEKCPNCGASMLRENSYHHNLFKQKSKNDKSEM